MSRSADRLRRKGERPPRPLPIQTARPRRQTMKYMLMIYGNDELWSSFPPEDLEKVVTETNALHDELQASGEFVSAYGVGDDVLTKQVTLIDGAPVVTDG